MNTTIMWVLDLLKKQGLSFVLLAFAVWYFYGEVQRLETKSDICNTRMMELYQGVILQNMDVMRRVEKQLEESEEATKGVMKSLNRRK